MMIEGPMKIVFWGLVGLLVGSAFGMVWHLVELEATMVAGASLRLVGAAT
jgi:hypothetical protein